MRRRQLPTWRAATAVDGAANSYAAASRTDITKAITFVCGLRLRGVVAPKAYDRAMNAETFEAWLEHHLLPTLEEGDIVVLDNLKAHKGPRVAEILAKKKCTVRY